MQNVWSVNNKHSLLNDKLYLQYVRSGGKRRKYSLIYTPSVALLTGSDGQK